MRNVLEILRFGGRIVFEQVGIGHVATVYDAAGLEVNCDAGAIRTQLLIEGALVVIETDRTTGYRQTYALQES